MGVVGISTGAGAASMSSLFSDNSIVGGLNLGASQSGNEAAPAVQGGNSLSIVCYARNWNILRVTLGLAGKAYAN